jgi:hypothetical protein
MRKSEPHFMPDAPERPQRTGHQWSLAEMFVLTAVVCGVLGLWKLASPILPTVELWLIATCTIGAAVIGLVRGKVFRYAAWSFVVATCLTLCTNWVVGLGRAIEYEQHPTLWKPIPNQPGHYRGPNGEVYP